MHERGHDTRLAWNRPLDFKRPYYACAVSDPAGDPPGDPSREETEVRLGAPAWDQAVGRSAVATLIERVRANDLVWATLHVAEKASARTSRFFAQRARRREVAKGLPGINTTEYNRRVWDAYDWRGGGEEWSLSPEWRQSIIDDLLLANMPKSASVLEIGPGGGRWSTVLREHAAELTLADVSEGAIEACRQLFAGDEHVRFIVTNGADLKGVANESIDYVWSFDVFVHIAPGDQAGYISEFARVMRPGARGVIHHAGAGSTAEGWRSGMTGERFAGLLAQNGLRVISQSDRWGEEAEQRVPVEGDVVTVFERAEAGDEHAE